MQSPLCTHFCIHTTRKYVTKAARLDYVSREKSVAPEPPRDRRFLETVGLSSCRRKLLIVRYLSLISDYVCRSDSPVLYLHCSQHCPAGVSVRPYGPSCSLFRALLFTGARRFPRPFSSKGKRSRPNASRRARAARSRRR